VDDESSQCSPAAVDATPAGEPGVRDRLKVLFLRTRAPCSCHVSSIYLEAGTGIAKHSFRIRRIFDQKEKNTKNIKKEDRNCE